jgi:hypothetical protein
MVLNTAFNENELIVCKPAEALDCFLRTRMDILVLGNSILVLGNSILSSPISGEAFSLWAPASSDRRPIERPHLV